MADNNNNNNNNINNNNNNNNNNDNNNNNLFVPANVAPGAANFLPAGGNTQFQAQPLGPPMSPAAALAGISNIPLPRGTAYLDDFMITLTEDEMRGLEEALNRVNLNQ